MDHIAYIYIYIYIYAAGRRRSARVTCTERGGDRRRGACRAKERREAGREGCGWAHLVGGVNAFATHLLHEGTAASI
eukprot:921846-Prorocentrum_minimum.AAC.2